MAISSKRTPARASRRIRRAISTASRPSPGAEKNSSDPSSVADPGSFAAEQVPPTESTVASVAWVAPAGSWHPRRVSSRSASRRCRPSPRAGRYHRDRLPASSRSASIGPRHDRHDEFASARRSSRQIDQQPRAALGDFRPTASVAVRNNAARSTLDARVEGLLHPLEQVCRGPLLRAAQRQQLLRSHAGEPKLLQRAGERARKSGRRCDGREVPQRSLARGIEGRPRRDGFGAQPTCWACVRPWQARRIACVRGELGQAEPLKTECCRQRLRRPRARDRQRRRAMRRRREPASSGRATASEFCGGGQPSRCKGGNKNPKGHRPSPANLPGIREQQRDAAACAPDSITLGLGHGARTGFAFAPDGGRGPAVDEDSGLRPCSADQGARRSRRQRPWARADSAGDRASRLGRPCQNSNSSGITR